MNRITSVGAEATVNKAAVKEVYDWIVSLCSDKEKAEQALEDSYMNCVRKDGQETEFAQAINLERRGGKCKYCGREFVKKTIGELYWYVPGCHCYQKCDHVKLWAKVGGYEGWYQIEGCGRYLVYEKFKGLDYCTHCKIGKPVEKEEKSNGRKKKLDK